MTYQKCLVPIQASMMLCFCLLMIGGLPLAMTEDNPSAHGIVLKAILLAPLVMLAGLLMHTPLFLEKFQDLRARAGEEGWYRALMVPKNNFKYVPWPKHSHPVARQAQWGGLETSDDVLRRGTLLKVVDAQIAKQKIRPARFVAAALLLIIGMGFLAVPKIVASLVYEVPPAEIVTLREFTQNLRLGFYLIGGSFLIFLSTGLFRKYRLAVFDKSRNTIRIGCYRCFGFLPVKSDKDKIQAAIPISHIAGLQIISYRSKNKYGGSEKRSGSRIEQFELNLVDSNSQRTTLLKLRDHNALLADAERLAGYLNVPIWDRSTYYDASAPAHPNPLVQPL